jgi:hypothetical protein
MHDESIPFSIFGTSSKSRNTTLFTLTVFEPRGRRGFGECSRDLDAVVEVGSDDVFLFSLGGSSLLDLLDDVRVWVSW